MDGNTALPGAPNNPALPPQPPIQDTGDLGLGSISLDESDSLPSQRQNIPLSNSNPFRKSDGRIGSKSVSIGGNSQSIFDLNSNSDLRTTSDLLVADEVLLEGLELEQASRKSPNASTHGTSAQNTLSNSGRLASISDGLAYANIVETTASASIMPEDNSIKAKRNKSEVYTIKHIRWHDNTSLRRDEILRYSPILTQNANGPCPLLALVNALVLTTPANLYTPLLESLRTREQISLGLLIDAVFDELMSDRRSGNSLDLPDVSALYSFLVSLHEGMNVNPRFVMASSASDNEESNENDLPGFENTVEMKLYGTFKIPLVHGWLPHKHEPAYAAFERLAATYEEAQNAQFREEELESKLGLDKLSAEEQKELNDVSVIKQFLNYWPTQLTGHGLDIINKSMKPGQVSILFRNDHFSTLYMEPRRRCLMTLVTDAGYATHDEIVWESLVDINGASSELFSGDFRSVSHTTGDLDAQNNDDWVIVGKKNKHSRNNVLDLRNESDSLIYDQSISSSAAGKANATTQYPHLVDTNILPSAITEQSASHQEDMDLALALQLQDEEDERERAETQARRVREDTLSRQYISQHTSNAAGNVQIPPRRSGQRNDTGPAPRPDRVQDELNEPAPPTYQEAASSQPFLPPRNHPSSEHAPLGYGITNNASGGTGNVYTRNVGAINQAATSASSRRRPSARQSLVDQIPAGYGTGPPRRQTRIETGMNSPHLDRKEGCHIM